MPAEGSAATWYQRAFVDGCEPRLVFLVHSDGRRRKVEGALRTALGRLPPREFKVLVLTFEEAPRALSPYVTQGVLPGTERRPERVLAVDEALLPLVRDAYNALAESYNATRRVIADHNARGGPQLPLPTAPRGGDGAPARLPGPLALVGQPFGRGRAEDHRNVARGAS